MQQADLDYADSGSHSPVSERDLVSIAQGEPINPKDMCQGPDRTARTAGLAKPGPGPGRARSPKEDTGDHPTRQPAVDEIEHIRIGQVNTHFPKRSTAMAAWPDRRQAAQTCPAPEKSSRWMQHLPAWRISRRAAARNRPAEVSGLAAATPHVTGERTCTAEDLSLSAGPAAPG